MNEFLFVFRRDYLTPNRQLATDLMQAHQKSWADWFRSLAAQNKLVYPVQRYDERGKVVTKMAILEGPYIDGNVAISGLLVVKAADYQEAVRMAEECPILVVGGTVEVRQAL